MTPGVLILLEHPARELDVACAVRALLASEYGLAADIHSIVEGPAAVADQAYSTLVFPYFGGADGTIPPFLQAWPNAALVNLCYEQLLSPTTARYKAPRDRVAREDVCHLAWGDSFADFLARHGVRKDRIVLNGNVALALCASPYRQRFSNRAELARRFGLDPEKQWVFFPENYAMAFRTDEQIRHFARGDERRRRDLLAYRRFASAGLREGFRFFRHFARNPAVELVLRVRPATPEWLFRYVYRKHCPLGGGRSLRFIKEGTTREWVLAADVTVSSYSTTLLEAAWGGRPAYLLSGEPIPAAQACEWHAYAERLTGAEDLEKRISDGLTAAASEPLRQWCRENLFARPDPIRWLAGFLADTTRRAAAPVGATPPPAPAPQPIQPRARTLRDRLAAVKNRLVTLIDIEKGELPAPDADTLLRSEIEEKTWGWARILLRERATPLGVVLTAGHSAPGLRECLSQLCPQLPGANEVSLIVVDQGIAAAAASILAGEFPRVHWVKRGGGGRSGAAARNSGICRTNADAVLLLDEQCRVRPGFVEAVFAALRDQPDAGILAFREASPGEGHSAGVGAAVDTRSFSPAACVIRASVLERLGFLEEALPVGAEEVEFSLRALAAGVRIRSVPQVCVDRAVGRVDGATSPSSREYLHDAAFHYARRLPSGLAVRAAVGLRRPDRRAAGVTGLYRVVLGLCRGWSARSRWPEGREEAAARLRALWRQENSP